MIKINLNKSESVAPDAINEPAELEEVEVRTEVADEIETEKTIESPNVSSLKAGKEMLAEDVETFCADLECFFRRAFDEIPNASDVGEIRAQQVAFRNIVQRASALGADANDQLATLTTECEQLRDAVVRSRADFLNYQSRSQKDLQRAEELALRGYVADILPVLDSLELALKDVRGNQPEAQCMREALALVEKSLCQALTVRGLERIETQGKLFDPNRHEAVAKRPVVNGENPQAALEELRAGYLWKGCVLRAAQVLVADKESAKLGLGIGS
ncbi:MAG: nucleotide exchange factor GrpE [Planctomycetota bacterium]